MHHNAGASHAGAGAHWVDYYLSDSKNMCICVRHGISSLCRCLSSSDIISGLSVYTCICELVYAVLICAQGCAAVWQGVERSLMLGVRIDDHLRHSAVQHGNGRRLLAASSVVAG